MINDVELSMVNSLRKAANEGALGYGVQTIEPYANELDADLDDLTARLPAVFVTFTSEKRANSPDVGVERREAVFTVLVIARHRRDQVPSCGDGSLPYLPGTYRILQDVRRILTGGDVDVAGLEKVEAGNVRSILNGDVPGAGPMSIYVHEFQAVYFHPPE